MRCLRIVFLVMIGVTVFNCGTPILEPFYVASPFDTEPPEYEEDSQLGFYEGNTAFANRHKQYGMYVHAIHDTTHDETWISALDLIPCNEAQSLTPSLEWRLVLKYKDEICEAQLMSIRRERDKTNPKAYHERLRKHTVTACHLDFDNFMEDYTNSKGNYVGKYFAGSFNLEFLDADSGEKRLLTGGRFRIITNKVGDNMIEQHEDDEYFNIN